MARTLFAGTGRSRTNSTTRATSRYAKTHRESAKTPASSRELRSFAYNILRHNQSDAIAQDRYAAAPQFAPFNELQ
jgi:hypothetical protein